MVQWSIVPKIVSISRRTDVPAFYGEWFMNRLEAGFAGWVNPFSGRKALVSLRRGDVHCLSFVSKNYRPFLPHVRRLVTLGYPCFFNYTITGLPACFESRVVPADDAVDSFRELAALFTPDHLHWRYDPIVISDLTPPSFHLERFAALAAALKGHARRCYTSFVVRYGKVERSFARLSRDHHLVVGDPAPEGRRQLALELAEIAARNGMQMHACCGDYLLGDTIWKGHCVDGALISRLYPSAAALPPKRPTRRECGCADSTDIGCYDSCPHGCVYCYANSHKERAEAAWAQHDPSSAFLGMPAAPAQAAVAALLEAAPRPPELQLGL